MSWRQSGRRGKEPGLLYVAQGTEISAMLSTPFGNGSDRGPQARFLQCRANQGPAAAVVKSCMGLLIGGRLIKLGACSFYLGTLLSRSALVFDIVGLTTVQYI